MNLIKMSIDNPVSTYAGVFLVLLFGGLGLAKLPVQLTPDVDQPKITVRTSWPGASPYEIENELIEDQEEVLKSLPGLSSLESSSYDSLGEVTLSFEVGTDLEAAMVRVANKLNEVSDYPENANRPVIDASGAQSAPIIWLLLKRTEGDPKSIIQYRTYFENDARQSLERVPGVSSLFVFGGSEKRLEIEVDSAKLARHGIVLQDVIDRVRSANSDVSAGVLGVDKRNYRLRTVSQFRDPQEPGRLLLKDDGLNRVYLRDVAEMRYGYAPNATPVQHKGTPSIVVGVRKEAGANVLALTARMRTAVDELNAGILGRNGLYLDWVYDQTPYINTAIDTVRSNLALGGALAVIVLLLYLRSISSTLTVALAIPISVVGTFIFLYAADRSINVVSLAGISFAVGMLVDNAIVVLENIDRHRRRGKSPFNASYDGTREVWGAVLASTVTTVAVFLPVIFIEEEAGKLFRDIAIAITSAILISLLVSISVIPAITNKLYGLSRRAPPSRQPVAPKGNFFVRTIMFLARLAIRNAFTRIAVVAGFTAAALLIADALLPKAEYLPQGNRNLILNIMVPPPGYSESKRDQMGQEIYAALKPYVEEDGKDGFPQIRNLFYVASDRLTLFGGTSEHETRARELMPLFTRVMNSLPGVFGVSLQRGIFDNSIGKGRSVDVNVSGDDNEAIVAAARTLYGAIKGAIPEAQIRPVPSLEITYPEANLRPDRSKVLANGFSEQELGVYVDVLMDGRKIGEFKPGGEPALDLVLTSDQRFTDSPEEVLGGVLANRFGRLVRVGDLADLEYGQGMVQINHLERKRNVTLEVTPPESMAMQSAMELVQQQVVPDLQKEGKLPGVSIGVGGNADKLDITRQALQWNFLLAVVITYLLMSALFANYLYPLIILFTVPLAAAGGFIGLALVNRFVAAQPFDILVMLGFIILVGTVVNNAILIVHQALNNVRYEGLSGQEAMLDSIRTRIRPIFMSTTTSLFGLLPLVLATGSGSEIYRGLGAVILGGLAVSTLLTLFVVPALLSFLIGFEKPRTAPAMEL